MKSKTLIIALLIGLLPFGGCTDFLETEPMDFVSPDNFSTENDIILALNGAYQALMKDKRSPISLDFIADNGLVTLSSSGEIDFWDQTHTPVSTPTLRKWEQNYAGILRANTVLKYAPEVSIEETKRQRYLGEALFLRAYFYADLIDFYGDVPYRVEPEGLEKKDSPRIDRNIIIDEILADLTLATASLPDPGTYSGSDIGRATKGAALALKAKILLYSERWEEAAAACQEVVNLNHYELHPDFYTMFSGEGAENNKEVIFDIQYMQNQVSKGMSHQWKTFFSSWSSYMGLHNLEGEYYMTNGKSIADPSSGYDATHPWFDRDPRLAYTFVLPYSMDGHSIAGAVKYYYPTQKKSANFSGLRIRKWVDYSDGSVNSISGNNILLLRYADVLLMRAEALLESSNWSVDKAEIMSLVNMVRQRPGVEMPKIEDAEGTDVGQSELRDIIRHERRVEFAFEGTRLSDIRRWEIGQEAFADAIGYRPELLGTDESQAVYELYTVRDRSFDTAKGYLWPIPEEEMQANLAIESNNPGY
ncbi:RagB/SusD family nutrient uptake outer membrane protein [Parapedobacter tibetensis]|uniref:RagB/SusD family nutrient uptake outer membrane protein n=1 Tax=Parapedobacter tibetensis TaxID=2972951 RepID=UPI00214DDED8|nr:RagB/SusD family nutrient uptake outer membrane protein [Parapedobacter tibetensis]